MCEKTFQPSVKTISALLPGLRSWMPSRGNALLALILVAAMVWTQWGQALGENLRVPTGASTDVIAYQGRLASLNGSPVNASVSMVFKLYNVASGGTALWTEQWTSANAIVVTDGLFNAMLGSLTPIPKTLFSQNSSLWLGITVGSDSEMAPRVQLGSDPFSIQASKVAANSITSAEVVNGSIQAVDLASGVLSSDAPVGTIISWWRADPTTPLPAGGWVVADGSVVSDAQSPLNGKTLPNLVGRFVMGVAPNDLGQTGGSNAINLAHGHTVDNHSHGIPSHNHDNGTLYALVAFEHDRAYVRRYGSGFAANYANYTSTTHANTHMTDTGADIEGLTGVWSGSSDGSQPGTNSQLSSSVDNRPEYYGVIFLIKIK